MSAPSRLPAPERRVRFIAQLWSQAATWPELRDAAVAAEAAGWHAVTTWDHLHAIFGPWPQPVLEGWMTLAAVAPLTRRVALGLMVGANTFRNPGHTAKLAVTLDHLSGGRAFLGIGGAWFEREHEAFGIDFGRSVGERLDRFDEAVGLMRRLLAGERFDHDGAAYQFRDAMIAPGPVNGHLPILVGGSGPRKTLRTAARYADAWNTNGTIEEIAPRVEALREHCAAIGRDPASIDRTVSFPIVLRDDPAEARRVFESMLAHNQAGDAGRVPTLLGPPPAVADAIRPYLALGFGSIVIRLPAPFDHETIARIGELGEAIGPVRAEVPAPRLPWAGG